MKKFTALFLAITFAMLIFWSCSDDGDGTTDPNNHAPTCVITTPAEYSIFTIGDVIPVNVDADDEDGSIKEVRFYFNDVGLDFDNEFPYSYQIETGDYSEGQYVIKAVAEDNEGAEKTSTVNITLTEPPNFILIPAGSFTMGQTGVSEPEHVVNIGRSFYMAKYETTQKEWTEIMESNPAADYGVGDNYPVYYVSWYSILVYCNKKSIAEGLTPCYIINGSTDPVDWGSIPTSESSIWNDVTCNFLAKGYRLPTEAEWEYAARYNDGRTYPWGEENPSSMLCNYNSFIGETTIVGSYPLGISYLGMYDMAGNLWEWVWDWHDDYTSDTQLDPEGPSDGIYRVLRGGAWYEYGSDVLSAGRNIRKPEYDHRAHGFRLARTK